jgi:hypothetical protein
MADTVMGFRKGSEKNGAPHYWLETATTPPTNAKTPSGPQQQQWPQQTSNPPSALVQM